MMFKPVLRFAVMSDCHYSEKHPEYRQKFERAMNLLYSYAGSEEYKVLDALYVVGDFTDLGKTNEMKWFKEDCGKFVKDETLLVVTMANHELHYMPDYNVALKDFKDIFNMDYDRHEIVNGYHFISLSTIRDRGPWDDSFNDEKKSFLKSELEKARKDTGNKPIFVFRHPGIPETIVGGVGGNTEVYSILSQYPQVIDFSGHSHNPVNDPREINQKNITTVGTGSMSYLSASAGWADFHITGDTTLGKEGAHLRVVEVSADGKVRIRGLDVISGNFFENDAYLVDGYDKSKHIYTSQRALKAKAPYFKEGSSVEVKLNGGKAILTFPRAHSEGDRVKEYAIRLFDENGVAMGQKNVYSDYMNYVQKDIVTVEVDWEYGFVPRAKVYALGFWENMSGCIKG